uniref:glucuronosyltransferase n=1 Tax=Meloidogyne hapla TaxID=6305 RepID=A0A1I8BEM4_MELHA
MKISIIRAFGQFPNIKFLWKLDKDTIRNMEKLPNVHTSEWFPHPNLRAFISHCGQNSLTESARAGVPIIAIPLFGDQFYNADLAEKLSLGLQIDVNELSGPDAEHILVEAIERILQDHYRQNAKIISKKIKLTPFSPSERLVKWVEFAAKFGDMSELNLPGDMEMNWFVYYSLLDVISFSIVVLIILVWMVFKSTRLFLSTINSMLLWFTKIGKLEKLKQK